ncbi:DUF485 domain-containing protein [Effusibacillus lacus]|uniref:DUF485 domain-containing protein n=1 Tax=Effusibacillus lacus TaxID=1348429 RepID=A0A292YQV0_9BACL|nr:DUF485 domain-containing protein [Effusibacillus lacus]TCS74891.1 uncharacterized membrane protein (DUF485 family) [Effusibacillus lacus]GAX91566.1 hypothetical protein EFBL_3256 [Effusibacillus lacus]
MQANLNSDVSASAKGARPQTEWEKIAESAQFQQLVRKKRAFLIPATIFFIVYYFALPILAGYAKPLMATKITDSINFGYLFALSQFVMAWALAHLYAKKADEFDHTASEMRKNMRGGL